MRHQPNGYGVGAEIHRDSKSRKHSFLGGSQRHDRLPTAACLLPQVQAPNSVDLTTEDRE